MLNAYTAPQVYTLGSVQELTSLINKVGLSSDQFTGQTGIVGVEIPPIPCDPTVIPVCP